MLGFYEIILTLSLTTTEDAAKDGPRKTGVDGEVGS